MKRRDFLKTAAVGSIGLCLSPTKGLAAAIAEEQAGSQFMTCCCAKSACLSKIYKGKAERDGSSYDLDKMLEDFGKRKDFRKVFYGAYYRDEALGEKIAVEMHDEYKSIIQEIPYVGENNRFLQDLIATCVILAQYRVLQKYGMTVAEYGKLFYSIFIATEYATSEAKRYKQGRHQCEWAQRHPLVMKNYGEDSQHSPYPDDYIFTYVQGNGDDFDMGFDFTQCPTCLVYKKYGAEELFSISCSCDFLLGKAENTGYTRTKTLAYGDDVCNMRWKYGGPVTIPYPY